MYTANQQLADVLLQYGFAEHAPALYNLPPGCRVFKKQSLVRMGNTFKVFFIQNQLHFYYKTELYGGDRESTYITPQQLASFIAFTVIDDKYRQKIINTLWRFDGMLHLYHNIACTLNGLVQMRKKRTQELFNIYLKAYNSIDQI